MYNSQMKEMCCSTSLADCQVHILCSGKAVWVSLTLPSKVNPHFPRRGPIPLQARVCKSYSVFTVLCRKPSHEQVS